MDFKKEVIEASKDIPVLVQFTASWCGPCRMFKPVMQSVADARDDYKFVLVDTEQNRSVAASYAIRKVPTIYLFYGGEPVAQYQYGPSQGLINQWMDAAIEAIAEKFPEDS